MMDIKVLDDPRIGMILLGVMSFIKDEQVDL